MSSGYYLLDHPNPTGPNYYTTRRKPLLAIVVHCTAGLEDQDMIGEDTSAEATARYCATTTRDVSWHSGSDSGSVVKLLPAGYTAWHASSYNSPTYGHEISKLDMSWADEPAAWVAATLRQAALALAPIAERYNIPLRHATVSELNAAIAAGGPPVGFIGHDVLDPTRRTDPGRDFPWSTFLRMVREVQLGEDDVTKDEYAAVLAAERPKLVAELVTQLRPVLDALIASSVIFVGNSDEPDWGVMAVVGGQLVHVPDPRRFGLLSGEGLGEGTVLNLPGTAPIWRLPRNDERPEQQPQMSGQTSGGTTG